MLASFRNWYLSALLVAVGLLTGCGHPWSVVKQAVPNPLRGNTQFTVMPLDFSELKVGSKSEANYLSGKDEDSRASFSEDKAAMNAIFAETLLKTAMDEGIAAQTEDGAPFVIHAKVAWIEPGFYAYVAKKPSGVRIMLRIKTADGKLVDEVLMVHHTNASMLSPSSGGRLRSDAKALGKYAGRYLATRVHGE